MKKTQLLSFFLTLSMVVSLLLSPVCAAQSTSSTSDAAGQPSQSSTQSEDNATSAPSNNSTQDTSSDAEDTTTTTDGTSTHEDTNTATNDTATQPSDTASEAFSVDAGAALLIELNSDTVVYELNADKKIYPASLTKMMTCLVALELCDDLSQEVTVSQSALDGLDPDGVTVSLVPGEVLTMEELLYCMMLPSANDACTVVAEHLCGSIDAFVEKMNEKATELGCTGTHFANPDGLHDDDHYTTARDLSLIARAGLQNETFRSITSTAVHEVPATNKSGARVIYSTNYLMSTTINPDYYYEKASGIKTGYTSQAGRCLVSTAKSGNFYYLSVVTGCKTINKEDGSVVYDNFVQTKKMLEYGLNNFKFATVLSKLVPVAQVPVTQAAVDSVVIAPASDITALLPADYDASKISVAYQLTNGDTLQAPLESGQDVGTITVQYDGKQIGQTTVQTITAVERHEIKYAAKSVAGQLKKYIGVLILAVVLLLVVLFFVQRKRNQRKKEARKKKKPSWDKD